LPQGPNNLRSGFRLKNNIEEEKRNFKYPILWFSTSYLRISIKYFTYLNKVFLLLDLQFILVGNELEFLNLNSDEGVDINLISNIKKKEKSANPRTVFPQTKLQTLPNLTQS